MTAELDAEELRRLTTWSGPIAQALRPEAPVAFTSEGLRIGRKGSLAQRAAAKAANFGSIYGMSAKGLSAAAWSGYGIELTESDAKLALDRFFTKYSGLRQWMRTHSDKCKRSRRVVIGAGRVVEDAWEAYPLGFPQHCNLPVQGACSDAMMRAIAYVHAERPGMLVAMVHDELLAEVPEAEAEATVETLKSSLHRAFEATFPGAPTLGLVDAHVGASWADLK